jgi:glutathione S-transferase
MKLYSGPLSLYSRKIEIALAEKGLAFDRVMVPFDQSGGYSPKHPDVLAANPKGQVPVLVDGDLALYDSTVILEYLEDAYPVPRLMPRSAKDRALCRQLELHADEVMLVPLRALMHRTGPRARGRADWSEREESAAKAEASLAVQFAELNARLGRASYFCGELSVADIAVFMMVLFSLRLGGPRLEPHDRLSDWYARLLRRPAFEQVACEVTAEGRRLSASASQHEQAADVTTDGSRPEV